MSTIKEMLDEQEVQALEDLKNLAFGSDERAAAIDELTKIHKMRMDEEKSENETASRKMEEDKQTKNKAIDWVDKGIRVMEVGCKFAVPMIIFRQGLIFEESGHAPMSFFFKKALGDTTKL